MQQMKDCCGLEGEQSRTILAEKRSEDSGTLDGDDVSHVGSFPACNVVPLSSASRLCGKQIRVSQSLIDITSCMEVLQKRMEVMEVARNNREEEACGLFPGCDNRPDFIQQQHFVYFRWHLVL